MRTSALVKMRVGAAALVALATLAIGGCGGSSSSGSGGSGSAHPSPGGTLRISQGEEVITLDPLQAADGFSLNVTSQINESLFKVNAEEETEPWLAESVKRSKDERVWTLRLRKGAEFSTGRPMTSADVLFTLEEARKSTYWESLLAGIEKVEAPSPSTIVITNTKPAPELPAVLSQWSFGIVPKDWGGVSEKEFAQHPVGTGPFMLGPWKHGESITLEKNPHYWEKSRPYLDKVVFQTVPNPESRVAQLKGGQLDAIYSPPWPQVSSIESTPGLEVGHYPLGFVEFLVLNSRTHLFENANAREAVYLALDRNGIVSATLGGDGEPAGSWIPPAVPYHDASIKPPTQDVARAKQLLSDAVKEGVDPSFTLLDNPESSFWGTASQIVQQNLEQVGFKVKIQTLDTASVAETLESGKFDASTLEAYAAIPSPSELFGLYNALEGSSTGADTTETTRLAEEASSAVDPKRREALWHRAQEILEKEKFLVTVAYLPYAWALQEKVAGFTVATTGIPWLADAGFAPE